ncbi:MAG: hypothetical protein M1833_006743 [Piccolia ochrophora]|nr:MAG: hypothetical protein M1833_006743 [Piccolia ochrophora]
MTNGTTFRREISRRPELDWRLDDSSAPDSALSAGVPGASSIYQIDNVSFGQFLAYLSIMTFTGSGSFLREYDYSNISAQVFTSDAASALADGIYSAPSGSEGAKAVLDNLAISMTNALRTSSNEVDSAQGSSVTDETSIRSIALHFTILGFVAATIYVSTKSRIPAWKSSYVAALQGLSTETSRAMGDLALAAVIERRAKEVHVRLDRMGDGWRLVESSGDDDRDGVSGLTERVTRPKEGLSSPTKVTTVRVERVNPDPVWTGRPSLDDRDSFLSPR